MDYRPETQRKERFATATKLDPAGMEIAAPFVNQFQIVLVGGNIRIAFAEGFPEEPSNYRSAVLMSTADALSLASSILNSLPQTSPGMNNQ